MAGTVHRPVELTVLVAKPGGGGGTYFGAAHCYIDCFDGGPVLDTASQALLGANLDKELVGETMIEGSNFGAEGAAFAAAVIGASGNAVPGRAYHDLWNDPAKNRTHANAIPPTTTGPTPNAPIGARHLCSFSGETEVLMADSTTKPIAEVEVGDWVVAEDPETGERGAREVTHLWMHQDTIIDLEIDGHDLATTEDHPFWNQTDQEWQRADALDVGDLVLTADGATLTVDGMDWGSARTTTAHNLTVDDIHTYFVLAGEDPLLVHNTCWRLSPPAPDTASKGVHFTIDGVELAARPGNGGSVVFRPVFSSTTDSAANAAIRQANNALATDTQFQSRLLANAERSLEYLQGNSSLPGATGRQAEVNFLVKALGG